MRRNVQDGVVLVSVLLVVALATVVAVAMLGAGQVANARSVNLRDADQAYLHALGAEDRARQALARDAPEGDHHGEQWSRPVRFRPGGDVEMATGIEDMQARFNLNNLVQDGRVSASDLEMFRRLLASVGLDPALAQPVTARPGPLLDPSELRSLSGFTAEAMERLAPFVTALPEPTPVNVNTASREVLASLAAGLEPRQLDAVLSDRDARPFTNTEQFVSHPALGGRPVSALTSVASRYFRVDTRVDAGRGRVRLRSLLRRTDRQVQVLARSRGED